MPECWEVILRSKNICSSVYENAHSRIRKYAALRLRLAQYSRQISSALRHVILYFELEVWKMSKKPNIIIFNPDEMRADTLGHLGNPAAVTPNLDKFACEEAVSFSNAFCQNPVCVPSRCSFFTGLYPHVNGHRTMSYLLHDGEDSLLKELKESGYYVWMNDRNDLLAGQVPGLMQKHADEVFYGGKCPPAPGPVASLRGEPGSKNYYSHFEGRLGVDEGGRNYSRDDEAVDAAIERLRHPVDDRPICIFLGLMFPHVPYGVEEPYYSAVSREHLLPRVKADECEGKAKILSDIRMYQNMDEYSENDWDELRATYLGMCMKVDEQFGRLVGALKELGIYNDSAVFFLSDHGDFAGDYNLVEKAQNSFEDCLTRVPFLIKPPSGVPVDPGVSSALTELVDFYATAMDLAGVTPSHTHFGKSLRFILKDREHHHRDYVFCEGGRMPEELHCDEYHEPGPQGISPRIAYWPKCKAQEDCEAHAKGVMIRDGRYKYVSRTLGGDEFYDLQEDPHEKRNQIGNEKYFPEIYKMKDAMLKWLEGTADIVPYELDSRFTPEAVYEKAKACASPKDYGNIRKMIDEGKAFIEIMQFARESGARHKK